MIRLLFALSLSIITAVLLALGFSYQDELPDSSTAVSASHIVIVQ
ncbi:MAG: hypothetical protein ABFR82_02725 [Nitrospirota bacterium]